MHLTVLTSETKLLFHSCKITNYKAWDALRVFICIAVVVETYLWLEFFNPLAPVGLLKFCSSTTASPTAGAH